MGTPLDEQNEKKPVSREKESVSPEFLPKPELKLLLWVGEHLKKSRKRSKTVEDVAKAAKVKPQVIEDIEKGIINHDAGLFRHIIKRGYGRKIEEILSDCYERLGKDLNPNGERPFHRDFYYAMCLKPSAGKESTPFFVAGDATNFLWAIPFRKLKKQPMFVDLLELAEKREKNSRGVTSGGFHDGIEVVHVINGSIKVNIRTDKSSGMTSDRYLKKGDTIHFNSRYHHQISNNSPGTRALLLIVRTTES